MNTILPIQYLRGIAALLVVWHHSREQISVFGNYFTSSFGEFGVDVFFVISGFIMFFTTANKPLTMSEFLVKRAERVVPLYWLATLFLVAAALALPQIFKTTQVDVYHIVKSILFIPHESPSHPGENWPILVPGWTLNYEMLFYFMFSLFLGFTLNMRVVGLGLLMGFMVTMGFALDIQNPWFEVYTNPLLLEFYFGVVVGWLYIAGVRPSRNIAWFVFITGTILLFADNELPRFIARGIPAFALVYGSLWLSENPPDSKLAHMLGDASYSIYLSHIFSLGALRYIWKLLGFVQDNIFMATCFMVTGLVFSAAIGVMVYNALERPMLRYVRAAYKTMQYRLSQNKSF